jgi:adenylate kinase family enzyme
LDAPLDAAGGVLIVTGPPGAGKTTVVRLLAASRTRGVHLEADFFWRSIVSGAVDPWKPESHAQKNTLVMRVGEVAARYARAGYFTVVDGIVSPRRFLGPLRDAFASARLPTSYVILRPAFAVVVERARARSSARMADRRVLEQLWKTFADLDERLERHVIDHDDLSADETATAIDERLRLGALAV